MDVAVVGGGYVGVTTALVLGEKGHDVHLVEIDAARREALAEGRVPFHEPGADTAIASVRDRGRWSVGADLPETAPHVVLVCVGTPTGDDGAPDLSQVRAATGDVADALDGWDAPTVVAVKSTVPPGTTRRVVLPALSEQATLGETVGVAVNPEFLREGTALEDARDPDRIVAGCFDALAGDRLRELYRDFKAPKAFTTPEEAELIKYASNALLATKIAFANEVANLCDRVGADVDRVMEVVGMDRRIGPAFLGAGLGFGGSCFPKDLRALAHVGDEADVETRLLDAVLAVNDDQPLWAVRAADDLLGDLDGARIALLGLAFKPGTDDARGTRALPIHRALGEAGAEVVCHDPRAGDAFAALTGGEVELAGTVEEALDGADACILQTAWPEYAGIAPATFRDRMRRPVVLDGRRALDGEALIGAGITYRGLGAGHLREGVP